MPSALKRSFMFLSLAALAALALFVPGQVGAHASTVAVPNVPAAARGVMFGTSLGTNTTQTVSLFPNAKIGRVFESEPKAALPALPSNYQIWLSFNTSPATVASGAFNATFASLLQAWNASGRTVYWDWWHEADNPRDNLNPTTMRAGWAQLLSVEKKYPNARVKSMSIFEGFLLDPSKPHGDPSLWYVNADVLGFDAYKAENVGRAMLYAKSKGKPWAIPEFGLNSTDAADVAYLTSTIQSWATYPPIGAAWFNSTSGANFSEPLIKIPSTLAYLRELAG